MAIFVDAVTWIACQFVKAPIFKLVFIFEELRWEWMQWSLHVAVFTRDRILQPPLPSTVSSETSSLSFFSSKSYTQRNLFNALLRPLRRLRLYGYFSLWAIKVNRGARSSEKERKREREELKKVAAKEKRRIKRSKGKGWGGREWCVKKSERHKKRARKSGFERCGKKQMREKNKRKRSRKE